MSRIKRGSNKKRFQVSGFGCQGTEVLNPDLPPAETLTPETYKLLYGCPAGTPFFERSFGKSLVPFRPGSREIKATPFADSIGRFFELRADYMLRPAPGIVFLFGRRPQRVYSGFQL